VVRYLARTPSLLAGLQLEDAAGELKPGQSARRRRAASELRAAACRRMSRPHGSRKRAREARHAFATEGRGLTHNPSPLSSPPPRATYRLQFHKDFTFDDAVEAVPYIAKLASATEHR
jgi:(1->4)-alpha-D-glucan 1-alpha-D-glucosylmutase